jgi:hydrogenase/urease accessory protein HupE
MTRSGRIAAAALVPLACCVFFSRAAAAHVAIAGADDFTAGLLHPLFVAAHLLTILALGLLLAQQGVAQVKATLPLFTAGLIAGLAGSGFAPVSPDALEILLLAAAATLGLLVALARPLPRWIAPALAAVSGLAIGLDSSPEAGSAWRSLLALTGTGISACLLVINVLVVVGYLRQPWQRIGVRVVGSWIGASALMVSALMLR